MYSQACDASGCNDTVVIDVDYSIETECDWTNESNADLNGNCQPEIGEVPIIEPKDLGHLFLKDPSFLDTKVDCVFEKPNNSSTGFKDMIKKFDGDFPVAHLRFLVRNDLDPNVAALTYLPVGNTDTPDYTISIAFNGGNSQAGTDFRPSLTTTNTLAHEVIHAEMFRKLMSLIKRGKVGIALNSAVLTSLLSNGDFPSIYDYYRRFGKDWQHQQMAAHYVDNIANIVKQFDVGKHSDQFYRDLAWEGLKETVAWNALSPSEQDRINKTINDYIRANHNDTCQ